VKKIVWTFLLLIGVCTNNAIAINNSDTINRFLDTTKVVSTPAHNSQNTDSLDKVNSVRFKQTKTKEFYDEKANIIRELISVQTADSTHIQLIWNDIGSIARINDSLRIRTYTYLLNNSKPLILDSTLSEQRLTFYQLTYINALLGLAGLQEYATNYKEAINNLYTALEFQKKHRDNTSYLVYTYEALSSLHKSLGNTDMVYNYNQKILQYDDLKGTSVQAKALTHLAEVFIERKDSLRYAINLARKSEAIFRSFTDDYWPQSIGSNYVVIGDVYYLMNKEDSAFFYHKKAIRMFIEDAQYSHYLWSYAYHLEASIYFKSKDYNNAISSATKGIEKAITGNYLLGLKNNYEVRYKSNKAIGNYKQALLDNDFFQMYQDSIESLNKKKVAFRYELEFDYKNQKITDQINNQKQIDLVNQKAKEDADTQERKALIAYISLFVLILISIFIWINNRQNKRLSKSLKEKNGLVEQALHQKELFMKEIHHRVKNNMQMVSSVLQLKSTATNNEEVRKELLDSQSRIFSMSLAHKLMYEHNNFEEIDIAEYTQEIVKTVSSTQNEGQMLTFNFPPNKVYVNVEQAQAVGFIMHELVLNSTKYAWENNSNKKITIGLQQQSGLIEIDYTDNGKGLPADFNLATITSMGLRLVRSFTERQLKGTIVFSSNEVGTSIHLAFTPRT
jgi:two-component sensor histidine kinase